jgi:putative acetyltransferase
MLLVREETPEDYSAIREINRLAFGGDAESILVDRLRKDGCVVVSLVAADDGRVAGHILFSELSLNTNRGAIAAIALAPVAVLPARQRSGIGSTLVRAGLESCRRRGKTVVAVLGHPEYYPRFGFSAELAKRLHGPYSDAGDAWMALELTPGALDGVEGQVRYPAAFDTAGH